MPLKTIGAFGKGKNPQTTSDPFIFSCPAIFVSYLRHTQLFRHCLAFNTLYEPMTDQTKTFHCAVCNHLHPSM